MDLEFGNVATFQVPAKWVENYNYTAAMFLAYLVMACDSTTLQGSIMMSDLNAIGFYYSRQKKILQFLKHYDILENYCITDDYPRQVYYSFTQRQLKNLGGSL